MIIVKLYGGIGNQMFQYAAAKHLAYKNNAVLKLDITHYENHELPDGLPYRSFDLGIFNIDDEIATEAEIQKFKNTPHSFTGKVLRKLKNAVAPVEVIYEPYFHYYPGLLSKKGNIYLDGYWQSEKYFKAIEPLIREKFTITTSLNDEGLEMLKKIQSASSVCLNVRRLEFASNPKVNQFTGTEYIYAAIERMKKEIANPHFFIFSDELEWCRGHIKTEAPHTFVSEQLYGEKFKDCLYLMSSCKYFIIPNSTFGWWAAWLGDHSSKVVIAPEKWLKNSDKDTKDVVPAMWIRI